MADNKQLINLLSDIQKRLTKAEEDIAGLVGARVAASEEQFSTRLSIEEIKDSLHGLKKQVTDQQPSKRRTRKKK